MQSEQAAITIRHPEGKPTPKQVYALAHELCAHAGVEFPATRGAASSLIQRLRDESERESERGTQM